MDFAFKAIFIILFFYHPQMLLCCIQRG